jgi:hypothetical protein
MSEEVLYVANFVQIYKVFLYITSMLFVILFYAFGQDQLIVDSWWEATDMGKWNMEEDRSSAWTEQPQLNTHKKALTFSNTDIVIQYVERNLITGMILNGYLIGSEMRPFLTFLSIFHICPFCLVNSVRSG